MRPKLNIALFIIEEKMGDQNDDTSISARNTKIVSEKLSEDCQTDTLVLITYDNFRERKKLWKGRKIFLSTRSTQLWMDFFAHLVLSNPKDFHLWNTIRSDITLTLALILILDVDIDIDIDIKSLWKWFWYIHFRFSITNS